MTTQRYRYCCNALSSTNFKSSISQVAVMPKPWPTATVVITSYPVTLHVAGRAPLAQARMSIRLRNSCRAVVTVCHHGTSSRLVITSSDSVPEDATRGLSAVVFLQFMSGHPLLSMLEPGVHVRQAQDYFAVHLISSAVTLADRSALIMPTSQVSGYPRTSPRRQLDKENKTARAASEPR